MSVVPDKDQMSSLPQLQDGTTQSHQNHQVQQPKKEKSQSREGLCIF